jgi:lipoprotein-anchoring transpeptidase ErfK/SrfK
MSDHHSSSSISRREFLKSAFLGVSGLAFTSWLDKLSPYELSPDRRYGRVIGGRIPIKSKPDIDSADVGFLLDDEIVQWLREVVGKRPTWIHQKFVEIPDGFIYAPNLQPVEYQPNIPLEELPEQKGMWVEVTVPYVDLKLQNPPPRSPWLKLSQNPRLYYSQIMWVDQILIEESKVLYRVKELYGSFGDVFWAPAEAFRPISALEIKPISPTVENKQVVVNVTDQSLSCFEGINEVYYCRISTGGKFDAEGNAVDKWSTPIGPHSIWRKLVSVHMTGGTTGGGYDIPGIGWTVLFSGNGVAVHSTFWHNSFGIPMSHGCVNASPEDAKWVFRWTLPEVPYESGDVTISGSGSSKVVVIER